MATKKGKKGTTKEKLRGKERQKYYYEKMIKANIPLAAGEMIVQMVDHNDYYFITNYGRVFSVYGKNIKSCLGSQGINLATVVRVSNSTYGYIQEKEKASLIE